MAVISWNDSLSVGVLAFDNQHRRLIAIINKLHDAMKDGRGKEVLDGIMLELVDYTVYHFLAEEKMFIDTGYPDYVAHKREHETFMKTVGELQGKMTTTSMMPSVESLNVLREWLYHHILESDKPIVPHLIETALSQKAASVMPLQGGNGLVSRTGLQG